MNDLDDLVFDDAVPPVIGEDEAPAVDEVLSCLECGKSLTYGGRGRKPKYCDEHRKASGKRTVGRASTNDKLAQQATEALLQINRLTGLGARILGLVGTSEMIMFGEDVFQEQAYAALLTDPALCKQILSAGQISAKFSLAIAYGMLGAQVFPVAVMELKERAAERAAKKAQAAGE
jgi:hypothetical protein